MKQRETSKRRIEEIAERSREDRLHPTLPVRRIESALFGGWGPRL